MAVVTRPAPTPTIAPPITREAKWRAEGALVRRNGLALLVLGAGFLALTRLLKISPVPRRVGTINAVLFTTLGLTEYYRGMGIRFALQRPKADSEPLISGGFKAIAAGAFLFLIASRVRLRYFVAIPAFLVLSGSALFAFGTGIETVREGLK